MAVVPLQRMTYQLLSGNALLSNTVSGRIYPEARAQVQPTTQIGLLPAIIFSVNEDEPDVALTTGAINFYAGIVEVLVMATTAKTAAEVGLLVLPVLHNRKNVEVAGGGSGPTPDTSVIMFSRLQKQLTGYVAPQNGEATGVFTHSMLFRVMYYEKPDNSQPQ